MLLNMNAIFFNEVFCIESNNMSVHLDVYLCEAAEAETT